MCSGPLFGTAKGKGLLTQDMATAKKFKISLQQQIDMDFVQGQD